MSQRDNINLKSIKRILITIEGKEEIISRDLKNFSYNISIHNVKIRRTESVHYYEIFGVKQP